MAVRITKTGFVDRTVLRVDGLLQAGDVPTLSQECEAVGGPVTLDLSQLRSADASGVEAVHELVAHGAKLQGLSPYLELLLVSAADKTS